MEVCVEIICLVDLAGVESATPNCLQLYDIFNKYNVAEIYNGTGVMGQV